MAKFFAAVANIIDNALHDDYVILATLDIDDTSMNNPETIKQIAAIDKVLPMFGVSDSKVSAINRDISHAPPWDILCLHSDDMHFTKAGFDLDIIEAMQQYFPDTDGMLHFPDQKAGKETCTYQIIGRKYYERQGYIYNPAYSSLFADNEETEKARALGKYAFIDKQILEHQHPVWGFGEYDRLLKHTQGFWKRDKRVFYQRKSINFGI